MIADDGFCVLHERVHGRLEWGSLCRAWEDVEPPRAARRARGRWLKRISWCWWAHRNRQVGPATWRAVSCRSCRGPS